MERIRLENMPRWVSEFIEKQNKLKPAPADESPTQAEIDGVAAVFAEVEDDPIARSSAYIMAKKLKRVFAQAAEFRAHQKGQAAKTEALETKLAGGG